MEAFKAGEKTPTAIDLHRELNALKQTEFAWMYEVSKCAPQEALRNLDLSFAHFFRRVKEKKAGQKVKVGFPKFKSKKHGRGSFRLTGTIHVFERAIQLPRLGVLRLKESGYLPTQGVHLLSATVSEKAGRWFVSLQVEQEMTRQLSGGIVLEGETEFFYDGQIYNIKAGDSYYFDSNRPHHSRSIGDSPAKLLVVFATKGAINPGE